jgi:hypothetical protein
MGKGGSEKCLKSVTYYLNGPLTKNIDKKVITRGPSNSTLVLLMHLKGVDITISDLLEGYLIVFQQTQTQQKKFLSVFGQINNFTTTS